MFETSYRLDSIVSVIKGYRWASHFEIQISAKNEHQPTDACCHPDFRSLRFLSLPSVSGFLPRDLCTPEYKDEPTGEFRHFESNSHILPRHTWKSPDLEGLQSGHLIVRLLYAAVPTHSIASSTMFLRKIASARFPLEIAQLHCCHGLRWSANGSDISANP